MKLSAGSTRTLPSVLLFVFYGLSLTLMTIAVKIDMSISYAIWSGVGTALIAAIGIGWFKEPLTSLRGSQHGAHHRRRPRTQCRRARRLRTCSDLARRTPMQ